MPLLVAALVLLFSVPSLLAQSVSRAYCGNDGKAHVEDEHLLAFSSMGLYFEEAASKLRSLGVDVLQADESVRPAEIAARCRWLDWDIHDRMIRYWLKGSEPGEVAVFSRKPWKSVAIQ